LPVKYSRLHQRNFSEDYLQSIHGFEYTDYTVCCTHSLPSEIRTRLQVKAM